MPVWFLNTHTFVHVLRFYMDPIAKRRMSVQIGSVTAPVTSGPKHNSAPSSAVRRGSDRKYSLISMSGSVGGTRRLSGSKIFFWFFVIYYSKCLLDLYENIFHNMHKLLGTLFDS